MPSYTFVAEDSSPFLTYTGGEWRAGSYSEQSYTGTTTRGAKVSFNFHGTSVGVYGSHRPDHGMYQVTVDGSVAVARNSSGDPPQYNQTYYQSGLAAGNHRVELENIEGGRYVVLDYVSWGASVGRDDEALIVNTAQDTHPAWTFEPESHWQADPPFLRSFSGASGHVTNLFNAAARLRFQGGAIAIYGASGPTATPGYSVQLNNNTVETFSAERLVHHSRQLLYYAGNLGPGDHEVKMTMGASAVDKYLSIDYAEVYTAPSLGGRHGVIHSDFASSSGQTGSPGKNDSPTSTDESMSAGVIVGIALPSFVAFLSLLLLAYIFRLYKTGKIRRASSTAEQTPIIGNIPPTPNQGGDLYAPPFASTALYDYDSGSGRAMSSVNVASITLAPNRYQAGTYPPSGSSGDSTAPRLDHRTIRKQRDESGTPGHRPDAPPNYIDSV